MTTDQVPKESLTRTRFQPVELDQVPEVGAFLERLGLGSLDPDNVTAYVGRNDNWAGPTSTGAEVFVKRLGGEPTDAARRFRRITAFEKLVADSGNQELRGPAYLGADEDNLLLAFERLEEARSGRELEADEGFDDELCRRAGRIIGTLHTLPVPADTLDDTPHPLPSIEDFEALSLPVYVNSAFAELEGYGLIQRDPELIEALRVLRRGEAAAPRVPTHSDLRLDQYLLHGDELYLTDWEEFRLGDAARDVGGFVGEWLYRVIQGIPKSIGKEADQEVGHEVAHEDILKHGAKEIERLRPRIVAFWEGYHEIRPETDEGFATRVAAFVGWHMLDRMLAGARFVARLAATDRAASGIGRTLLLTPDNFGSVLGLEATS
ncbi:hypothetical protein E0L36_22515 [Streptomyces sp. AJS327]|uniref:class V lanthionine synthetase subunit LxmK n=1 Tax=Streptomyces sp. AJS327 TaxID=2545265 RepID=UPI0015DF0E56|nr:class V lanthionine synthetase subunit LxmK [Streptomyces sp. AJS327]MBA0053549.1 hypothetical protein [Streptomyces sp. AJS327]